MDDNDKHGVRAEIGLQLSEATTVIIQPTDSDINQDRVSANSGLSADIPTYSTDNYTIRENIKYEPLATTHEDHARSHQIECVHLTTGLQTATYGHLHQAMTEKTVIRSVENSSQETISTQGDSEFIEIKQEIKSDVCGGNTDLTRYWVTCPGGILKEVKAEHKLNVSAILPYEDCSENDDQKERVQNGKKHTSIQEIRTNWKLSSTSPRGLPLMRFRRPDIVLNNHEQKTHNETRPLSGGPCVPSFTCSRSLGDHAYAIILYSRPEFPKSSTRSDHLEVHGRVRSSMKQFNCDTCGKSCTGASYLKLHGRTHTGVKPCICDTCGKTFISSSQLKMHERTHTGVKPFTCDTCGKSFFSSSNLKVHERIHTGVKPFKCDSCGKQFVQSGQLKLHERTHTGLKPFTCDMCGKSFTESSNLKVHKRRHTGVKHFKCDSCGKSFVRSDELQIHERIHTGVKPFKCDTCGKQFAQSGQLKVHERTHTGLKPLICDTCGKSFAASKQLKVHERTHTRKFTSPDMA